MDRGIQDFVLDLSQQLSVSTSDCCLNSSFFEVPHPQTVLLSRLKTNLLHILLLFSMTSTFWRIRCFPQHLALNPAPHTGRQQAR